MPSPTDTLLEALLDSWDRNNRILVNVTRALSPAALAAKPTEGSHTVAELLTHVHYIRMAFLEEDVPGFAGKAPADEWVDERDPARIAAMLDESAKAVRDAVEKVVKDSRPMKLHYDHPILFLQHMIWHEGYHHGQIKLALKAAGIPMTDRQASPLTWGVWMRKKGGGAAS